MARIPEAELERIKRETPLVDLVRARGIKLQKHGKDLAGLCCFHDDHEPSLIVEPRRNLFHCFGCGAKGSVVDWVMKTEGVSFRHAVELLRTDQPVSGNGSQPVKASRVKRSTVTKLPVPFDQEASDQELLNRVTEYYHETLLESPEAQQYLESRGLDRPDLISHFRLGFSNRTLGYRLPNKQRAAGAAIRGRLQDLGIYRDTGHEHLSGCLVFPVFDAVGNVAELYGRKITRQLKRGIPLHLYLPGPHRGVWNVVGLEGSKEVILCESLIDALSFWCAGFQHVTAAYGTNGFTDEHVETFQCLGIERVLIAYDRDEAGELGAETVAERLEPLGIACFRIQFPKGLDANEYACKVQPATKSLSLAIRHAIPMREGLAPGPPEPTTSPPAEPLPRAPSSPAPSLAASSSGLLPEEPIATPEPPRSHVTVNAEITDSEVVIAQGDRRYRVRGLERNTSYNSLRVNVLATRGESMHVDTLDLHLARQRTAFINQAAEELQIQPEVVKKDLAKIFLKLEELQEEQIKRTLEPGEAPVVLSNEETRSALDLLRDPRLLDRILEDFERCGVVGEETNKLTGYLAALSRKLEEPLAVVLQSSSAAGKSSLMDAILAFVPEEERVQYSAMTGQSLFYMGETDLQHKVLAIVEEEGAERATYALKLLQSEGELTIASTGKDPQSGRLLTHEYRVQGPVMIFLTTTAIEIDEELLNRCLVLTVDEDREQTRAIHRLQREQQTLEGLLAKQDRQSVLKLHQNAQRLLRPLLVANPWARELTFLDTRTRTRRDHCKYLTLIRTIALLHQHQRPKKTTLHRGQTVEYIEVELDDVETANRLAHEVLGRSLDELPPQTRRLLLLIDEVVREACEKQGVDREDYLFTRRQVREHTGWSDFQVRTHLRKLEQLEYVLVHRGGRGQSFVYELLYDGQGQEGQPFLLGLIETPTLRCHGYDSNPEHPNSDSEPREGKYEHPTSPQSAPNEPASRSMETADEPSSDKGLLAFDPKEPGKALKGSSEKEVVRKRRSSTKASS